MNAQSADDFRRSFRDALAATIGDTGLEARFDLSAKCPGFSRKAAPAMSATGSYAGWSRTLAYPESAWPTHLSVTY